MATEDDTTTTAEAAQPPVPGSAPARPRRALTITAIAVGGVLTAGLLFGGGVLVGAALPIGGGPGMSQGHLPAGALPPGVRPDRPVDGPQNGDEQSDGEEG